MIDRTGVSSRALLLGVIVLTISMIATPGSAAHEVVICSGYAPTQPTCERTFVAEHDVSGSGVTLRGVFASLVATSTNGRDAGTWVCAGFDCIGASGRFSKGDTVRMVVEATGVGYYEYRLRYRDDSVPEG